MCSGTPDHGGKLRAADLRSVDLTSAMHRHSLQTTTCMTYGAHASIQMRYVFNLQSKELVE